MSTKDDIRILTIAETVEKCGLSRTAVYKMVKDGDFPEPVRLSGNRVGWRSDEVREWIEGRPRDRVERSHTKSKPQRAPRRRKARA